VDVTARQVRVFALGYSTSSTCASCGRGRPTPGCRRLSAASPFGTPADERKVRGFGKAELPDPVGSAHGCSGAIHLRERDTESWT
jgi:hypothetical protein